MNGDRLSVRLIPTNDNDDEELFELGGRLRAELDQLDVLAIEPVTAQDVPEDAKGLAEVLGWVTVVLAATEQLVTVVDLVRGWSERNRQTVEVSIDGDVLKLSGATRDQQEQIVAAWLARHAP